MSPRLLLACSLPLALACDGLLAPEPMLRTNIGDIAAPDSVTAGVPFSATVVVTHGPCQRPLTPRVSYLADTAILEARVKRDDRVFGGACDADVLLSEIFEVSVGPRPAGTLVLRSHAQTALIADTVIVVNP